MIASFAKLINPGEAYPEVLRLVTRWFDADWGQIITTDLETGKPRVRSVSPGVRNPDHAFSSTILKKALKEDEPLCIPDAKQHPAYRSASSVHDAEGSILSVIVVPLHNQTREPIGALYLQRRSGTSGFYNQVRDLQRLAMLMDTLSPLLFEQEQQTFFESLRVERTRSAMSQMGFIVGQSKIMDTQVYTRIDKFAQSSLTVCIQGETGTGKELVASAVHRLSPRAKQPFIRVPCNAIPKGLAESEFFGHVRGAFAQAFRSKSGQFEMAQGGTIFLDEISRLPVDVQAKLLHVLERGASQEIKFYRVGGVQEICVDVRVITSSNRNLRRLVAEGMFLEDLYHRVNQLPLYVPPLRERREDIVPLTKGFLDETNRLHGTHLRLSEEARAAFQEYDWPGNVRELKSCIQRAMLLHEGGQALTADELLRQDEPPERLVRRSATLPSHGSFKELSRADKLRAVQAAMQRYGDARKAAKELGVSRQTIYNYLADAAG
jgi:transcriptional regulator with GAF, ATPase, and Fis domain